MGSVGGGLEILRLFCLRVALLPLLSTTPSSESDTVLCTSSSSSLLVRVLSPSSSLLVRVVSDNTALTTSVGLGSSTWLTFSSSRTHLLTWYFSLLSLSLHSPEPNILKKSRDFLLNELEGLETFCLFLLVSRGDISM